MPEPDIRVARYDDPDATTLIDAVQQEYVELYGTPDESAIDPRHFDPPEGAFFVAHVEGDPVAMGGWRRHGSDRTDTAWAHPAAEIKRMYVAPAARGRGLARAVLGRVEGSAAASGCGWLLLETGLMQPAAIALYRSAGYVDVPHYGHYAESPEAVHLGKRLG